MMLRWMAPAKAKLVCTLCDFTFGQQMPPFPTTHHPITTHGYRCPRSGLGQSPANAKECKYQRNTNLNLLVGTEFHTNYLMPPLLQSF